MISTDSPIQKKGKEDVLKRAPLAEKVAQLIKNYKGKESYVIGIEGIWGAGKTSFINLILENFKRKDVDIIKFNPWNFSSQNQLISDFFDSFTAALDKNGEKDELKQKLTNYSSKLLKQSMFEFNPSVKFLWFFEFSPGKIKKYGGVQTLTEIRESIDVLLKRRRKKILVVIDDIDRLDKQETLLILKMVKMTANFPNTVFLLAYDREKVASRITERGIEGHDYLKKIIQVSFTIPVPDKQNLRGVLFSGLDKTLDSIYGTYVFDSEEQKHWEAIFRNGFSNLFVTIRDINRFLSSLQLNWSVVNKEDVNPVDFIAVEALRIFVPTYYNVIAGNKYVFLNKDDSLLSFPSRERDEERQKIYKEILDNEKIVPKEFMSSIDGITRELFPQLKMDSSSGSSYEREWRLQKRICSEQKFDFYFQLSVPEDEVSEVEVQAVLSTKTNEDSLKEKFLLLDKEKKLTKTIDLLLDRIEKITQEQIQKIIVNLWNIDGHVSDTQSGLFGLNDFNTQVGRLTYQALKNIVSKDKRADFILNTMNETQNIHFSLRLLDVFGEQIEKNDKDILVDKKFVEKFRKEVLKLIKKKVKNGKLEDETRLDVILFRWLKWGNEKSVKNYIRKLVQDDVGLIKLLDGFTGMVHSSNKGSYETLGLKSLGELYPIKEIEKRIMIYKSSKGKNIGKRALELIDLFENPPKEW